MATLAYYIYIYIYICLKNKKFRNSIHFHNRSISLIQAVLNSCALSILSLDIYSHYLLGIYIYIYILHGSVTLGFMHFVFIRQSEAFKKRPINMVNFLFKK